MFIYRLQDSFLKKLIPLCQRAMLKEKLTFFKQTRLTSFSEEESLSFQALELLNNINQFSWHEENSGERENAWQIFNAWEEKSKHKRVENSQLFLAWYLFRKRSKPGSIDLQPSFAKLYIEHSPKMSSIDRYLIEEAEMAPLEFFETYEIPSLNKVYLKSLCQGYRGSYAFFEFPLNCKPNEIFLAKIIPLSEDQGIVLARGPNLHRSAKAIIADLKRNLVGKRRHEFKADFTIFEADIFSTYLEIVCKADFIA
jgi:hypothetical protein